MNNFAAYEQAAKEAKELDDICATEDYLNEDPKERGE